jgi:hypothetical protein
MCSATLSLPAVTDLISRLPQKELRPEFALLGVGLRHAR